MKLRYLIYFRKYDYKVKVYNVYFWKKLYPFGLANIIVQLCVGPIPKYTFVDFFK